MNKMNKKNTANKKNRMTAQEAKKVSVLEGCSQGLPMGRAGGQGRGTRPWEGAIWEPCTTCPLKQKWSHFDLKSWVTGRTIIRPGIPSNCRIFESNWISSQFESNILQLLGIPGRIIVPPVTQLFRSKWLHFSVSSRNTQHRTIRLTLVSLSSLR